MPVQTATGILHTQAEPLPADRTNDHSASSLAAPENALTWSKNMAQEATELSTCLQESSLLPTWGWGPEMAPSGV